MVEFLIKELGYSEASAMRRLKAARLLSEIPQIEEKIKDGSLNLSNLSKVSTFFRNSEIQDIKEKKAIIKQLENKSSRECEKTLFSMMPDKPLPKEEIKVVSESFQQLKVNISDETLKSLHEARALLNCWTLNDECLGKMAKQAAENLRKKRFKLTNKGRATESTGRYVTHSMKRDVAKNSSGVCENCGSLFMLQFDHREAYSLGGKTESSNLRLLCFQCNQRSRIRSRL